MTQPHPGPLRLTADWLLPGGGPPIAGGALLIGIDGRIEAAGPAATVPLPPGAQEHAFPGAALLPGFVNAHTHLELTGFGRIEEADFSRWIRGVRQLKAGRTAAEFQAAARQGVRDAFAAGITMVLDTGDSGAVLPALVEAGAVGVAYQEVFGPDPAQLTESLDRLTTSLDAQARLAGGRVRLGVSPHAPYTVSGPLYRAAADLARARGLPLAVHVAESLAETAFVSRHQGPFAAAWDARGLPPLERHGPLDGASRRSPVAWLDANGVLGPTTLCIHTVQLDLADVEILRRRGAAVAHCPVSNRRHGHGVAPVAALRAAGVPLGIGTDSVVSVGRLDMFAELRAARQILGCNAEDALELGAAEGARLAGQAADVGRLRPGFFADVIAVDLPAAVRSEQVAEAVLGATTDSIRVTFVAGRLVYYRGPTA